MVALTAGILPGCEGDRRRPPGPGDAEGAPLEITIDAASRTAISPYIYGINAYEDTADASLPRWPRGVTLSRFGGNRLSAYNWENNASNAGSDYDFQNDGYLGGGEVPGEAARMRVVAAAARGAGIILTVPMLGHVAGDKLGTTVGRDRAGLGTRLATRFRASRARKGAPFAPNPDTADAWVNQDEFVWWLEQRVGASVSGTTPLFYGLDNEPDLWGGTHEEVRPHVAGSESRLTYDELIAASIDHASAIKSVSPGALVFGPSVATWTGAATLGRWPMPDPRHGRRFFLDVYLERMRAAERTGGRRLLDVLDLHWYPAAGAGAYTIGNDHAPQSAELVRARLQAPRSLWDSTYDEGSWVNDVEGGPIALLPRLREKVAIHYPGTRIAITEYYYGRGGDISGGIAQADVLGILGREGVFAATMWPNAGLWAEPYGGDPGKAYAYLIGAFRAFRDFDGRGGRFGSHALDVRNPRPATASVYASADSAGPARIVVVAINKLAREQPLLLSIESAPALRSAAPYVMAEGLPVPEPRPSFALTAGRAVAYVMPPLSVTTLVMEP